MNDAQKPAPRTGLPAWMIIAQLLALASLALWLFALIVPVAFWDSPGKPGAGMTLFLAIPYLYPLFPIGMSIAGWAAFSYRRNKLAVVFTVLSIAPPLLLIIVSTIGSILSPIIMYFYFMLQK